MYAIFIKELKSIYRQVSKSNKFVKFAAGIIVIYLIYHFMDISGFVFNWRSLSNIHYGREGLAGQPKSLVYYSMNGCPYCRKFDPKWDEFKTKLKNSDCTCEARKVDSKDPECQKNGVQGFPTILLTDSSKNKIKECPTRDPDAMLTFCKANQ
tara:strand:- start:562 stop:1020 length:459 start_codon:yes stop_codon:yes gene_type:complete